MREFSVPPVVEVSDSDHAVKTVFARAQVQPDAVALRVKSEAGWHDVTCQRFRDEVSELAEGLIAVGIEPGARVGLMSRTRYEWTLVEYAIWAAGAVAVPIYETSSAEQVEWILQDSGAVAVFLETPAHREMLDQIRDRLPELRHVWVLEEDDLGHLIAAGAEVEEEELIGRRAGHGADDLAAIIYTSGTTGRPKGCEITHHNLLFDVRNAMNGPLAEVFAKPGGSTLLFLPLAHVFAQVIQVGCMETGLILGHSSAITDVLPDLESFAPTFLLAVPRVFEKLYNGAELKAQAGGKGRIFAAAAATAVAYSRSLDAAGPGLRLKARHRLFDRLVYAKLRAAIGGRVTHAVSGSAALGERLGHFFRGAGLRILEGYGLTETTAAASVNPAYANKIGTVGPPVPGTAIRIADDGEIMVRGPHVLRGYWRNEQATKEVLEPDGWLHTGDIGQLDEDGYLRITGRKKEIIVTAGGKNVVPAVLEDRLRAHPLISQVMVVGDGKPFVAALVTVDAEALAQWARRLGKTSTGVDDLAGDDDLRLEIQSAVHEANKAVSRAESIKKFKILETDFTEGGGQLTPTLKVKRNVVSKEFSDDIAELYAS